MDPNEPCIVSERERIPALTGKRHGKLELVKEGGEAALNALLAVICKTPQHRATAEHCSSAQCNGLEHVRTLGNAPVQVHLAPPSDSLHDLRQHLDLSWAVSGGVLVWSRHTHTVAGAPSSCRPPWFDIIIAAAPSSMLFTASSAVITPCS